MIMTKMYLLFQFSRDSYEYLSGIHCYQAKMQNLTEQQYPGRFWVLLWRLFVSVEAGSVELLADHHTVPGYIAYLLDQVPSEIFIIVKLLLLNYSESLSDCRCIYFSILELLKQISIHLPSVHIVELPQSRLDSYLICFSPVINCNQNEALTS